MKKNFTIRTIAALSALMISLSFTACGDKASETAPADNGGNHAPAATYAKSDEAPSGNAAPSNASHSNAAPSDAAPAAEAEYYDADDADASYSGKVQYASPQENRTAGETAPEGTYSFNIEAEQYDDEAMYMMPEYDYNSEEYAQITENEFLSTRENPLSTFSADVDTASYTNIRRLLTDGSYIPADAVRIEEILNYFDYDYPDAAPGEPFSVTTELSDCPWNPDSQLLLVGIKAREDHLRGEHIPKNLVFLIDVSGSMYDSDKLPIVQQAFTMLTGELNEYDTISIVTYAGSDEVLLDGESGINRDRINRVIGDLSAGGSTAGAAGILTAYEIAEKHFIKGGNNRVILATDGDLNVGPSSVEELTDLIERERNSGIYLSVLGFGTGNYKDDRLEAIADNGNGNYSYIDCLSEAKKVLIDEMDSTLTTVAKDVKFQVEFNPANVSEYRLIGYENRALADRDFNDDTKDAGEVGAGSTVTVLYEIKRNGPGNDDYRPEFRYGENEENYSEKNEKTSEYFANGHESELLTVNIRCKKPDENESSLWIYPVTLDNYTAELPKNLNFAACCAEFGMLLRGSRYAGTSGYNDISDMLTRYDYSDDEYKIEFSYLVNVARTR